MRSVLVPGSTVLVLLAACGDGGGLGVEMRRDAGMTAPLDRDASSSPADAAPALDASVEIHDASTPVPPPPPPPPPATATRYPIVIVHGLGASAMTPGLARVHADLVAAGYVAFQADLPPFASSETRGTYLAADIDRVLMETGAAKVNLIAHSQGGLDSRHAISGLGYGDRVASLTTISSPHRGSAFADVALGLQGLSSSVALDALVGIYGDRISDLDADTAVRDSLVSNSEGNAPVFDAAHPDDARVFYQSWAGLSNAFGIRGRNDESACVTLRFDPNVRDALDPILLMTSRIVGHGLEARPNDGLVSVDSAKWGMFHGCIPADHFDEVGERNDEPPNAGSGFDFLVFYRGIAADLESRGY